MSLLVDCVQKYQNTGHLLNNFSFGKAKRNDKSGNESTPGPGNYEEKRNFGNGPKISMTFTRPQSARANTTPGPGYYESHVLRPSTPQIK
jgi:hypothetical protein